MASSTSGCRLQQLLRSFCLNTEWKYAVFWKLKHRARMVLTWEDAYYDNLDQLDPMANHCFHDTIESLHSGRYSHDTLGLSVAKMSYHVYSLGEGIVGQVAASGKHQWIFADKHVNSYCLLFELCDGWQSQFASGIRTVVVIPVGPHGVVQLGSLNKVYEDVKLVSHIRNVFFALQDSSVGHISSSIECSMKNSLFKQGFPAKLLDSEVIPLDNAVQKDGPDGLLPGFSHPQKYSDSSFVLPLFSNIPKGATEVENKHEGLQLSSIASDSNLEHQNQLGRHLINNGACKGETNGWKKMSLEPENVYANSPAVDDINLFNVAFQAEQYGAGHACYSSNFLSSALNDMVKPSSLSSYPKEVLDIPKSSDIKFQNNSKKLGNQNDLIDMDSINTSLKFSAGCELFEALGPAFLRNGFYADSQVDNAEAGANIEMQEGMSCSQLTFESGSENLLEAVVANVCHSGSDMRSERSFCRSAQSSLITRNTSEPSSLTNCTVNSAGYSINKSSLVEDSKQHCLNSSELCGSMSSKAYSSTCPSNSKQFEKSSDPAKNNKKRARPGENARPRPRDRQLIQDRIKELRELVPNGAKCSIDSLLERTIKHMVFLQGISKHADKLGKCAESKMHQKGAGMLGSSNYDQGSSWAVEVGSPLKVCSIIVENINKNGQMVVELLCEECSHFLEIAEAIRSLGLTILKGITEAHGEKTWICFVVEGQNRVMHRMDILWSLVHILQSKATS
ncbi:hypothetical protein E1A91_D08G073700v1 [Gossypium mustelinum]|uniref:BHLH domain-containing protein n=1 Tax=Gossypium mustelinum TaxID=34275 RepID=A0A5D2TST3_GOSMU|nr:hypothetical protein E1A91_D08G073700v1 [Gossypium mustelinum]